MKRTLLLALAVGALALGWSAGGPAAAWLYKHTHAAPAVHPQAPVAPPEGWVSVTLIVVDGTPETILFTTNYGHQQAVDVKDCDDSNDCTQAAAALARAHHGNRLEIHTGKRSV